MTSPKAISFVVFILLIGTILSFCMDGIWFSDSTRTLFGTLTAFKTYTLFGLIKVPWVNIDFFTVGLPKLLSFNFAFFGGGYGAFRYGLYVFSIGIIWGIASLMISVIYSFWSRTK